jgi:16S rRNA (cytosine967-C5)-methyltransferase
MMEDRGGIVALDISHRRLLSLSVAAKRLGIRSIRAVAADASGRLDRLLRTPFDRILLDGPCSGLGVLSRHPDGKWSRGPEDMTRLADLQVAMISAAVPLMAGDGLLLYTTCTISKEENDDVVARALRLHPDIRLVTLRGRLPRWGEGLLDDLGFFRTYPHVHGMDGFFGAMFGKAPQ